MLILGSNTPPPPKPTHAVQKMHHTQLTLMLQKIVEIYVVHVSKCDGPPFCPPFNYSLEQLSLLHIAVPRGRVSASKVANPKTFCAWTTPCPGCTVKQQGGRHCCQRGHHKPHTEKRTLECLQSAERPYKRLCLPPKRPHTTKALRLPPHVTPTPPAPKQRRPKIPQPPSLRAPVPQYGTQGCTKRSDQSSPLFPSQ